MLDATDGPADSLADLLHPGEVEQAHARAEDGVIAVTHKRVVIQRGRRLALDAPIEGLRSIQFDIERTRPATMVIVPDEAMRGPHVLAIPVDQLDQASQLLALIGKRLGEQQPGNE